MKEDTRNTCKDAADATHARVEEDPEILLEVTEELGISLKDVDTALRRLDDKSPRTNEEWEGVYYQAHYSRPQGQEEEAKKKEALAQMFMLARTFEEWDRVYRAASCGLAFRTKDMAFAKMHTLAGTAKEWARVYRAANDN